MRHSTRRRLSGVLLGLSFSGALACSGGSTIVLGNDDSGRTVALSGGDELVITLGSIGNQGQPSISSTAIRYEGSAVVGPANPGGPTIRYRFAAVRQGAATITIPFTIPNNPPPFVLDVSVE
jgi:hypothetical protein